MNQNIFQEERNCLIPNNFDFTQRSLTHKTDANFLFYTFVSILYYQCDFQVYFKLIHVKINSETYASEIQIIAKWQQRKLSSSHPYFCSPDLALWEKNFSLILCFLRVVKFWKARGKFKRYKSIPEHKH